MNKNLIVYGYNNKNLGDDLMFASILNNSGYEKFYFYGDKIVPEFVSKKIEFIKCGRALPLRWKFFSDFAIIGGSVVMGKEERSFKMIKQKINFFMLNKLLGGRNFIVGANLGPYRDKEEYSSYLKKLDKWINHWFVRDTFSSNMLDEISSTRCTKMPDIVMGFPVDDYINIPTQKRIAISVTKVNKDGKGAIAPDVYMSEIVKWVEHYVALDYEVDMLSFEDSIDISIINDIVGNVSEKCRSSVDIVSYKGDSVIKALAKAEIIISTRFHCMVLGALLKKKQIIYSYSDKTKNFAGDYNFTVYSVTGEIQGKVPVGTQFNNEDVTRAKQYPQLMRESNGY